MTEEKSGVVEKVWPWVIIILAVAAAVFYSFYGQKPALTLEQAKIKAGEFINKNLLQGETTASISQVAEENGLYKISLKLEDQEFTSFMTRDGKKFFFSGIDMDAAEAEATAGEQTEKDIPKTEKPTVELFVMSYCPFGLQAEKGILPVVNLLRDKIDFQLKFVDYLMHGEQEMAENLRQYCVSRSESRKLTDYLACFSRTGKAAECLISEKIDAIKLAACENETDAAYNIKKSFADKALWRKDDYPPFDVFAVDNEKYDVSGSPAFVVNGTMVSPKRDAESLKKMICGAFIDEPAECATGLSPDLPSAGFGEGAAGDSVSAGNCN